MTNFVFLFHNMRYYIILKAHLLTLVKFVNQIRRKISLKQMFYSSDISNQLIKTINLILHIDETTVIEGPCSDELTVSLMRGGVCLMRGAHSLAYKEKIMGKNQFELKCSSDLKYFLHHTTVFLSTTTLFKNIVNFIWFMPFL